MGEVRRGPKGVDDGGTSEFTEGGGEMMAWRRRLSGRSART
jgi:hypothetical protein